jgi:hypothetical protein
LWKFFALLIGFPHSWRKTYSKCFVSSNQLV